MTFIDFAVLLLIVCGVGAFFYFKKLKKPDSGTPVPNQGNPANPGVSAPYVPDSATIKDNASGLAYWNSLAPSTRAYMRPPPYFGPNGEVLDVRGAVMVSGDNLAHVVILPATTDSEAIARNKLQTAIRSGNPYSINDILAAGFTPDGAQFAAWFRQVKA